jgi:hypothetical protein
MGLSIYDHGYSFGPGDDWAYDPISEMYEPVGDPQDDGARDPDGYCKHGVYVGGCGIDWMCGACECGD